ncbi:MAG: hypothetical protein WAT92_08020 [Saprospiraceae bacterium]
MQATRKLTNLQIELLEVFKYELPEDQLKEIRTMLVEYFSEKVTNDLDNLFEKEGWGAEKIEEWAQEHMRSKSV